MKLTCTINTDGGSRGNPGPAAFGYVIHLPGDDDIQECGYLGHTTNNIAEYTAVLRSLQHAAELGMRNVQILSDSELMVKQMTGVYKVKNPDIQKLHHQISQLLRHFDKVLFKHIYREENAQADKLCNQAMDDQKLGIVPILRTFNLPKMEVASKPKPAVSEKKPAVSEKKPAVPECPTALGKKAIAYLRELQEQWSDDEGPPPEEAWAKIWEMIHQK